MGLGAGRASPSPLGFLREGVPVGLSFCLDSSCFMEMPSVDGGGIWEVHPSALRPLEVFCVPLEEKHPEAVGALVLQPHRDTERWQQARVCRREGFKKFNFTRRC